LERSCKALWPQGQGDDSTICSFNSCHHPVRCCSPSLDVHHKLASKSEMQLQDKFSNEEIRKQSHIPGD
ncbi:16032_t:CDS:1, partial [Funneliformis geosporum]